MSPEEIEKFATEVRDGRWPVRKAELQEFMAALLAPAEETGAAGARPTEAGSAPTPPTPAAPTIEVRPPSNPTTLGDVWVGETLPVVEHVGVTRTSTGKLHIGPEVVRTYTKREGLELLSAIRWLVDHLD